MPPDAAQTAHVRLEAIGAADDLATLPDETIAYFWDTDGAGDVLRTALLCAESVAAYEARRFAWSADGQSTQMQSRQSQYQERAERLRARLVARTTSVPLTRAATAVPGELA